MSHNLIDTLKRITEIITTISHYLNSDVAADYLPSDRDSLIENITTNIKTFHFQDSGYSHTQIKELVTELVDRKLTDDHGWFIDTDATNHDQVVFIHPQRTAQQRTLVMAKSHALLPYNLLA